MVDRMKMEPLTEEQKRVVEANMHLVPRILRYGGVRVYASILGEDESRQLASVALMRAVQKYDYARFSGDPDDLLRYARSWARSILGKAAQRNGIVRDKKNRVSCRPGPARVESIDADGNSNSIIGDNGVTIDIEMYESLKGWRRKLAVYMANGLGPKEIGAIVGISRQRAQQLMDDVKELIRTNADKEKTGCRRSRLAEVAGGTVAGRGVEEPCLTG